MTAFGFPIIALASQVGNVEASILISGIAKPEWTKSRPIFPCLPKSSHCLTETASYVSGTTLCIPMCLLSPGILWDSMSYRQGNRL